MYEIKIIDEARGELPLDLKEASFPITIENSSVTELTDQSASWSYNIDIPRSPNNEEILEHAGSPYVTTLRPYRRLACNVYADGIIIVRNGVLIIDTAKKNYYSVQIVSGNADIFERMDDIEFDKWQHAHWTHLPKKILPAYDASQGFFYAREMYVSKDKNRKVSSTDRYGTYIYATPLLRIFGTDSVMERILDELGYTLVTDTDVNNLCFALSKRDRGDFDNDPIASYTIEMTHNTTTSTAPYWENQNVDTTDTQMELDRVRYHFYGWFKRNDTTTQSLSSFVNAGGKMYIQFTWAGGAGDVFEFPLDDLTKNEFEFETDMELTPNIPRVGVRIWSSSTTYQYAGATRTGYDAADADAAIDVYAPDGDDYIYPGQQINLECSTGYETALDLFKVLAQAFGWVINVDGYNKVIEARSFAYIVGRKTFARDWSSKIVEGDTEKEFTFGNYARNNTITLKENQYTEFEDEETFTIDNENLDANYEAVKIKVASGYGNVVEQYNYEESEGYYRWKSPGAAHMLICEDHARVEHYMASKIKTNYSGLITTLQRVQVLTENVVLTPYDIQTFEPFTPVYLSQYGSYFYVNKISDWEAGKTCQVELLKI